MAHQHDHDAHNHKHTVWSELICHFPYAVFSVAFSLALVSFIPMSGFGIYEQANDLFHSFHFMHVVFAATGSMLTFLRYSRRIFLGLIISTLSTSFFCILSDAVLPYIGGRMLGVDMSWHICFATELHNVLPFLFVGLLTGIVLNYHEEGHQNIYSIFSHFVHIFVSSIASTFYLISHGFTNWNESIGYVFLFLVFAVVVPCTCSDVIVPMYFARANR